MPDSSHHSTKKSRQIHYFAGGRRREFKTGLCDHAYGMSRIEIIVDETTSRVPSPPCPLERYDLSKAPKDRQRVLVQRITCFNRNFQCLHILVTL
jgi:hypothetical protein